MCLTRGLLGKHRSCMPASVRVTASAPILRYAASALEGGSADVGTLAVYLGMLNGDLRVDEPEKLAAAVRKLGDQYRRMAL
jgi:hypothetical protein